MVLAGTAIRDEEKMQVVGHNVIAEGLTEIDDHDVVLETLTMKQGSAEQALKCEPFNQPCWPEMLINCCPPYICYNTFPFGGVCH